MSITNLKGIIVISIVLVNINFAQTTIKINPQIIDTVNHKVTNKVTEKRSLKLDELKLLQNNSPILTSDNNNLYVPSYITDKNLYRNNNISIDGVKLFNKSLYKLLAKEYEKRGRYDLGDFGRYLGSTKKIVTIILWLLSF